MRSKYKQTGIYRITNKINGKSYIGKTGMNFGDRWDSHRALLNAGKHDNPHLQRAWNKYGAAAFEFAIVELVSDPAELNDREIKYIADYRNLGSSYNIHDGGDGGINLGKHLSAETKQKIGSKNRAHMLGRKATDETKGKMSASQSARYALWTKEQRADWGKMTAEKASGYRWSDEAKASFAEKQRQAPNSAKFTPDDVRAIRQEREEGATLASLAEKYHTSQSYISSIIHRRRWAFI